MRIIERDIVGGFIFSGDDKLLIGKSCNGGVYADHWIIPGGGIEVGESQLDALAREILEETGLDIAKAKVEELGHAGSGISEKTLRDTGERVQVEMQFYNFIVRMPQPAAAIAVTAEDDFIEPRWTSVNELHDLKLSPPTVETLQAIGFLKAINEAV